MIFSVHIYIRMSKLHFLIKGSKHPMKKTKYLLSTLRHFFVMKQVKYSTHSGLNFYPCLVLQFSLLHAQFQLLYYYHAVIDPAGRLVPTGGDSLHRGNADIYARFSPQSSGNQCHQ